VSLPIGLKFVRVLLSSLGLSHEQQRRPPANRASGEEAHRTAHHSVGPAVAKLCGAGLTRNTAGGAPAGAIRAPSRREERSREKEKNTAERARMDPIGLMGSWAK